MRILVAVDGSKYSLDAVRCLIDHADWYRDAPEVLLVTVHLPVPKLPRMGLVVGKKQLQRYYQEEGETRLAAGERMLRQAGVPFEAKVLVGPVAETLVKHARDRRCDLIYIGNRGMGGIGKALLGSVANSVLQISDTPVLLVK